MLLHGSSRATADNHDGIRVEFADRCLIEDCQIRHVRGFSANSNGIKVYKGRELVVQNCRLSGSTMNLHDKDNGKGNHYRRNIVEESGFLGNNQNLSEGLRIYENLFLRGDIDLCILSTDLEIHDNTIYGGRIGNGPDDPPIENARFWNNIVVGLSPDGFRAMDIEFAWKTCDYNLYYHPVGTFMLAGPSFEIDRRHKDTKVFPTLAAWQKDAGCDRHSLLCDPGFVDADRGDFRLKPGSPALTAGKDGGPIGAFTTSGPRMGVRGPWRDRQPLPEEEARAAEAWKKVEAARPVAR